MINDFSILVSSCDKFSDLWQLHFDFLKEHWKGEFPQICLVTDKKTEFTYEGIKVLVFDGDMPRRLKLACEYIDSLYVLITLDDYFTIDDIDEKKIGYLKNYAQDNNVDYLRIYDRRYAKEKYYRSLEDIKELDLNQKYVVNLYPALWNKNFFIKCVDDDCSPWIFEPQLTHKALEQNAKCFINNSGVFNILDVVRKGKVLHKANRYFKSHGISSLDRPLASWKMELKQTVADFICWHMPKWVYYVTKKIAKAMGMTFFSD